MYRHYSAKFERDIIIIHPGEYHASSEDVIISTVLGSCVSVVLFDPTARVGGMNHFMLPGSIERKEFYNESGKYGMYAMELLINEILKMGGRKERMRAKVFGGGHVLRDNGQPTAMRRVPDSNVEFARDYIENEHITIDGSDVGGTVARKVLVFPTTFRVLLKRITGTLITRVEAEEEDYFKKIQRKKPEGEVTLF